MTIRKPTNDEILFSADGDQTLDTGMKVSEAIDRARQWWETKGRRLMKQELARQSGGNGNIDKAMGAPFVSDDPDSENFMPARLIRGLPWDELDKADKLHLVKCWHHWFVRKPDKLGENPDERHRFQDRGKIQ